MTRVRNLILFLLVVVCGASFWLARQGRPEAGEVGDGARLPTPSEPEPTLLLETVHLAVLNGTGEAGLARMVSRLVPAIGCVVVTVADAPHDSFATSLLVNRRLDDDRLQRLASDLARPVLLEEWDPRQDEDAVLVLGRDFERLIARLSPGS